VRFGIGGDRDFKRRHRLQARDELDCIGIAVGMRTIRRSTGDVAAQRNNVPHPGFPIGLCYFINLGARCLDARQVRRRRHSTFGGDTSDGRMGAFARRTPCAIGHRDKARRQRFERPKRVPQLRLHLFGLGREKFKADADVTVQIGEQRRRRGAARFRERVQG